MSLCSAGDCASSTAILSSVAMLSLLMLAAPPGQPRSSDCNFRRCFAPVPDRDSERRERKSQFPAPAEPRQRSLAAVTAALLRDATWTLWFPQGSRGLGPRPAWRRCYKHRVCSAMMSKQKFLCPIRRVIWGSVAAAGSDVAPQGTNGAALQSCGKHTKNQPKIPCQDGG